jgi:uncharacterized protein (DUF4415 family)
MKTLKKINPEMIDDENPEWTAADFKRARPAHETLSQELLSVLPSKPGKRGPQKTPRKELVTVRYSRDVLQYFRETGAGWQTRMDEALKEWISAHR